MLIDWVLEQIQKKIMYWKFDEWPLHVRLQIVQAIRIPYFLYYLPLLDWRECHFKVLNIVLATFIWNKHKPKAMVFISRNVVSQPKQWGVLGIIHAPSHMHACRATFMKKMFDCSALWCHCLWEIITLGHVYFHGKWNLDDWKKLFSHAPLIVQGRNASMLTKSWKSTSGLLIWTSRMRYTSHSLAAKNVFCSFISVSPPAFILGSPSRYFFNKGICLSIKCLIIMENLFPFGLPKICTNWVRFTKFLYTFSA